MAKKTVSASVLRQLMDARVHLGHRTRLWNPRMAPYILGVRNGMHIINLDRTVLMLTQALRFLRELTYRDGRVLWLGPRELPQHEVIAKIVAKTPNALFTKTPSKWVSGTLTNGVVTGRIEIFDYKLPDALFVLDSQRNSIAIAEAREVGIPVVAIVDTDCNPDKVTYPIPGNDESTRALHLYASLASHAMADGARILRQEQTGGERIFSSTAKRAASSAPHADFRDHENAEDS